jgi:hypothetical protein
MSTHAAISALLVALLLVPPALIAVRSRSRLLSYAPDLERAAVRTLAYVSRTGRGAGRKMEEAPGDSALGLRSRLRALPRQELYELARAHGITGRSRMSREQLVDALVCAGTTCPPPSTSYSPNEGMRDWNEQR